MTTISTQKEETPQQCAICSDTMTAPTKMGGCTHNFCFECIRQSLERDRRCPMCRAPVNSLITGQTALIIVHLLIDRPLQHAQAHRHQQQQPSPEDIEDILRDAEEEGILSADEGQRFNSISPASQSVRREAVQHAPSVSLWKQGLTDWMTRFQDTITLLRLLAADTHSSVLTFVVLFLLGMFGVALLLTVPIVYRLESHWAFAQTLFHIGGMLICYKYHHVNENFRWLIYHAFLTLIDLLYLAMKLLVPNDSIFLGFASRLLFDCAFTVDLLCCLMNYNKYSMSERERARSLN